ncbi:Gfo/Idh/MocA family oxidoreductase [Candidatus Poribacteria bacterium]|nr:Gfo/Idh/MocA family oxidoreductase [Candidatus Poribacteria bacterium]
MKIAVVGLGNRGPQHLCTIAGLKDLYRLVGVCDMAPEKLEANAEKFGVPGYGDAEEMLDKAKPDLVVFTVSPRDLSETEGGRSDDPELVCRVAGV